jgi:hypothetical protein
MILIISPFCFNLMQVLTFGVDWTICLPLNHNLNNGSHEWQLLI